jgi:hypothetical protein
LTANLTTVTEAKAHLVSFSYVYSIIKQQQQNNTYLIEEIDDDTVWFPAFWY